MPKISLYPNGCTAGVPPQSSAHARSVRDIVTGWSSQSCRRNTRFLYSIDAPSLTGEGLAVTFTLKDCPPTSDAWHKIRRQLEKRLRRLGLIRGHWVTEWQRRGVPHLHGALYFPGIDVELLKALKAAWLAVAAEFSPESWAQHITPISDAVGWFGYVSKHASRGVNHYQRNPGNIPAAWAKKTGRVWGKVGQWPVREAIALDVSMSAFWAYRRIVRGWRLADARKTSSARRIRSARSMLQSANRDLCSVRGVSEWITLEVSAAILGHLSDSGHRILEWSRG